MGAGPRESTVSFGVTATRAVTTYSWGQKAALTAGGGGGRQENTEACKQPEALGTW